MKKFKMYSYTILLIISMIFVCPLIFRQIWKSSAPQKNTDPIPPAATEESTDLIQSNSEVIQQNNTVTTDNMIATEAVQPTQAPTEPPIQFVQGDISYFDDVLFIGDSRTVGISEYGTLKNADFFCNTGMSVYNLNKARESIDGIGSVTLESLLSSKTYGKIYFMLGINELGYEMSQTIDKYRGWIDFLRQKQPDAIIFIQANLHVTKARSDSDSYITNPNINTLNGAISRFADGKHIFFIDPNEYFDDETGSLRQDYTNDNVHLTGIHYQEWCNWLCTKTVQTAQSQPTSETTSAITSSGPVQ